MKATNIVLASITLAIGISSCKHSEYQETPGGIEYKILENHHGPKAKVGNYLKLQIITSVPDTVLMDTHKRTGAQFLQLQKPNGRYDLMEALAQLSEGDSAILRIPADSVIPEIGRPPYIHKGDYLTLAVKLVRIETFTQMETELKQAHDLQLTKDENTIEDFLNKNHLKGIKTPEGVYIVTHALGTGPVPQTGQQVQINYTGKSLEGKAFDSNIDSSLQLMRHPLTPLKFTLGSGQVMEGMDDAMRQLKKGAKVTIYIPSGLAYGPQGEPPIIQPNEILAFDIDLLDVSDSNSLSKLPKLPTYLKRAQRVRKEEPDHNSTRPSK